MIKFYSFLFAVLLQGNVKAQSHYSTFTLEGNINIDTGTMVLSSSSEYYPNNKGDRETKIVNGKFQFTDSILYPCAFNLMGYEGTNRKYVSDIFFVDSGAQKITCHVD